MTAAKHEGFIEIFLEQEIYQPSNLLNTSTCGQLRLFLYFKQEHSVYRLMIHTGDGNPISFVESTGMSENQGV